jgi:hypothetical protein
MPVQAKSSRVPISNSGWAQGCMPVTQLCWEHKQEDCGTGQLGNKVRLLSWWWCLLRSLTLVLKFICFLHCFLLSVKTGYSTSSLHSAWPWHRAEQGALPTTMFPILSLPDSSSPLAPGVFDHLVRCGLISPLFLFLLAINKPPVGMLTRGEFDPNWLPHLSDTVWPNAASIPRGNQSLTQEHVLITKQKKISQSQQPHFSQSETSR